MLTFPPDINLTYKHIRVLCYFIDDSVPYDTLTVSKQVVDELIDKKFLIIDLRDGHVYPTQKGLDFMAYIERRLIL